MIITISLNKIKAAAYLLLLIPVVLFFFTWLQTPLAVCLSIMITAALYFTLQQGKTDEVIKIPLYLLIGIVALMLIWSFVSGQGGFVPQKWDHAYRNAIFRDMITYTMPVTYPDMQNGALVYYIGYWIVPALFGKLGVYLGSDDTGWLTGNIAMLVQSTLMLSVMFLLIMAVLKKSTGKAVLLIAAMLILFSGMDILEGLALSSLKPINWEHLEWSLGLFQYSSNSTQLCWVFNQTTPAWLAIALFLQERKISSYAVIGLLLLPFAPLIVLGLLPFAAIDTIRQFLSKPIKENMLKTVKQVFSPANVLAVAAVLPVFYFYYTSNMTFSSEIGKTDMRASLFTPLIMALTVLGILCEGGILALLIFKQNKGNILYLTAIGSLAIIPWIHFISGDFQMRASVAALFILMILTTQTLLAENTGAVRKTLITAVLLIGAVTPAIEYISLLDKHKGNSDYVVTLSIPYHNDTFGNFVTRNKDDKVFFKYLARQ